MTTVIADGGYRGAGLVIPHRRERGQSELPAWKEEHNASHRKIRARVERAFARIRTGRSCATAVSRGMACSAPCSPTQPHPRRVTENEQVTHHAVDHLRETLSSSLALAGPLYATQRPTRSRLRLSPLDP